MEPLPPPSPPCLLSPQFCLTDKHPSPPTHPQPVVADIPLHGQLRFLSKSCSSLPRNLFSGSLESLKITRDFQLLTSQRQKSQVLCSKSTEATRTTQRTILSTQSNASHGVNVLSAGSATTQSSHYQVDEWTWHLCTNADGRPTTLTT